MASDLLLKPAERARLAKVKEMLAKGENPYAQLSTMVIGSSTFTRVEKDDTERIKALEAKWADKTLPPEPLYLDDVDFGDIPTPVEAAPGQLVCSYCGNLIDEVEATWGKGSPKITVTHEVVEIHGVMTIEDKVKYSARKIISCRACLPTNLQVKFPDTD